MMHVTPSHTFSFRKLNWVNYKFSHLRCKLTCNSFNLLIPNLAGTRYHHNKCTMELYSKSEVQLMALMRRRCSVTCGCHCSHLHCGGFTLPADSCSQRFVAKTEELKRLHVNIFELYCTVAADNQTESFNLE